MWQSKSSIKGVAGIIGFLESNEAIISLISGMFTAVGTVGAVIVAVWFSYRNSRAQLKVCAWAGIITNPMREHVTFSCTNTSKQYIRCQGFSFAPKGRRGVRLLPHPQYQLKYGLSDECTLPVLLHFSENFTQLFDNRIFDAQLWSSLLSKHRWIARFQLRFRCRVVAHTNIKSFYGKLSEDLIEKIISLCFH